MCKVIKELTCIGCPVGCFLKVELDAGTIVVTGNNCKQGKRYGEREVTNPARTLTTTVRVLGGKQRVLPVRTNREIPKDKIFECMKIIKRTKVAVPVQIGEVIILNIADTGADVILTKTSY